MRIIPNNAYRTRSANAPTVGEGQGPPLQVQNVWNLKKYLFTNGCPCGIFNLQILNYILTTIMTYGVILLIVLFQPELRIALEQLGSSNKWTKYFGLEKDIISKTKEGITGNY